MTTLQALEVLLSAYDAHGHASRRVEGGDLSADAVRAQIATTNVLLDRCIDAGMALHEPDHVAWAAERVARFLVEA